MRNDKDFKDGHMNREPHKRPEMKKFVHGAKETIKGPTKTPPSPMQKAEAKIADIQSRIRSRESMERTLRKLTKSCSDVSRLPNASFLRAWIRGRMSRWRQGLLALPGISVSLLPKTSQSPRSRTCRPGAPKKCD